MVEAKRANLAELALRAQLRPAARLDEEAIKAVHRVAQIRDYSARPALQLKAATTLLKTALPTARKEASKEPVHILVVPQLQPPAADASEEGGLPTI